MNKEQKYFNVKIEFDREKVDAIILDAIEKDIPGYVCAIESNNLTVANKNPEFMEVVNGALVNSCDGSVLAKILAWIHHGTIRIEMRQVRIGIMTIIYARYAFHYRIETRIDDELPVA